MDIGAVSDYVVLDNVGIQQAQCEVALLLPKTNASHSMVELMNDAVTVKQRAYNGLGLLYLVEGRACDIQALLDLGFMEWV